ncbi:hypothetical protein [Micromonospora sp. LOL_021]|uniref:hypothetical protein n=1 Tax=Micromonospora sp. LOL_021 TaxID=3345417 RepID=UPI003A8C40BC
MTAADPAERDALELLALSQRLPLPAAVAVAGSATLEALERRGLVTVVTVDGQQFVQLSHRLYAEMLRAATPVLARLRHSRRLADTLEAAGQLHGADVMRVALWRLDGGGDIDVDLMLAAAREAAFRTPDGCTGTPVLRVSADNGCAGLELTLTNRGTAAVDGLLLVTAEVCCWSRPTPSRPGDTGTGPARHHRACLRAAGRHRVPVDHRAVRPRRPDLDDRNVRPTGGV